MGLIETASANSIWRVCSKDIAAELLEMTFGAENELSDW